MASIPVTLYTSKHVMNILLLTEHWTPKVGGVERYLTNLVLELQKTNTVKVIAPKGVVSESELEKITTRKRFFLSPLKPSWLLLYREIERMAKRGEIDVLLCGKGLFEGLLGYYLKKKHGIPYVIFTYAMEIEVWKRKTGTYKKLQKALAHADRVIYINSETRTVLEEFGVESERLVKLYPAVEQMFFETNEDTDVLKKYNLAQPYIITVARLIARKGVDDLISAYAQLDQTTHGDVRLVVVGDGPEKESLQRHAEQLFVEPLFLSDIPDTELSILLRHAELFALTPKDVGGDKEGFGIVYLEAAACGLASIGTRHGGVPEAVVHNETGLLVEEGNVEEIHEALTKLLEDKAWAQKLGETGKKRAADTFTWEKQVTILENHLHAIVK